MQKTNLYTVTVPPMMKALTALKGVLDKASTHAESKKTSRQTFEESLLGSRIIFDQFPLARQIQVACDNAKAGAARLAEIEAPSFEDNEKTIGDLKARIDKTLEFMKSIKPEQIIGKEGVKITLPYFPDMHMEGLDYVNEYLLPNFYFHLVTAYQIMRKNGVELGKQDYMGSVSMKNN